MPTTAFQCKRYSNWAIQKNTAFQSQSARPFPWFLCMLWCKWSFLCSSNSFFLNIKGESIRFLIELSLSQTVKCSFAGLWRKLNSFVLLLVLTLCCPCWTLVSAMCSCVCPDPSWWHHACVSTPSFWPGPPHQCTHLQNNTSSIVKPPAKSLLIKHVGCVVYPEASRPAQTWRLNSHH